MATKLSLSQACEGMIRYKMAAGKSEHTIVDYRSSFKKLHLFFPDDPPFSSISRPMLIEFFAWLQNGYETNPDGVCSSGKIQTCSEEHFEYPHQSFISLGHGALKKVSSKKISFEKYLPRPLNHQSLNLSKDDIALLMKACSRSRTWKTNPSVFQFAPNRRSR